MSRFRLSVVVPAYNNAPLLDLTLGGLARQTMPAADFEVIVSDDGSPVPLAPAVDKYADRLDVTCVVAERNRGRSAARNAGAARARADVLLFVDADSVAHPALLERHAAFHAAREGRPGVLLGKRYDIDWAAAGALTRGESPTPEMLDAYRGDPRDGHTAHPQHLADFARAPWLLGFTHNASVDKATFDAVGGFDEAIVKWGLEDSELFYRVFHHHGCPPDLFVREPAAMAYHMPHYRPTGELLGTLDNLRYIARKHPRYDFEAMHSPATLGQVMGKVRLYSDAVDTCRRAGLGRPAVLPAEVRAGLGDRTLIAGYGVSGLPLGPGSHTFDQDAPIGDTNWHRLGLMLQDFRTGQFSQFVHIDLWRFLMPDDLSLMVTKALRKADRVVLVAAHDAPDAASLLPVPFVDDVDYAARMLEARFDVATTVHEEATVLTIR
ncbi:glycosyltransferase [Phytohabitans sp. LJ34]|uniref:glycosyltransferase n=1 Tax=Phytohabitans sp. LJ34 TaxID=3452217 RepID=UPI003F8B1C57